MTDVPAGHLYLGTNPEGEPLHYEASNLTTHGVIVGMTGSGKTGLGMIMLEEALMQGIPTLIIDPKGDMGNLLLTFPDLAPADFEPWINPTEAQRDGVSVAEKAASTAAMWKSGLERSGIGPERIGELRQKVDFTIYTPGSTSGVPLNIIGSLKAPAAGTDEETMQDEINGFASSLLGLVDVKSDPISGREHILIANILHHFWAQGLDLDLGMLIGQIQTPPMRKLGVIDLDTFFPANDRMALALKINGLAASPAFASWAEGPDLDIDSMLYGPGGKPRAAVVSIAHLSDDERQFVVTLLLSKVVTWMRSQSGTPDLRALIYMDEVFGFVPPSAQPPSKKPILTILKQARAFGVGLVLSTQNPVDIDYKALSNAGTWMIGRLQTERDRDRLLDGLSSSSGAVDTSAIGDTISSLDKRQFVLHSTKASGPSVFGTRWAMSYLPGPLTRDQISQLTPADAAAPAAASSTAVPPGASAAAAPAPAAAAAPVAALAADESSVAPPVADTVDVRYVDPAAPWSENVRAVPGGRRLVAGVAARVQMLFDDTKADLRHEVEWEAVVPSLSGAVDFDDSIVVDYDERDLRVAPPEGAVYVLPDAKIKNKTYFTAAKTALKDHLYRNQQMTLFRNAELKVYSTAGETREEFEKRCLAVADERTDEDASKLRDALEKKEDRIKEQMVKAEDRIREIEFDAESREKEQRTGQLLDIGGAVLGGLLGGRKSTRSILSGVRRSQSKGRMAAKAQERLRTAENRYGELAENLEELEDQLVEDMAEIQAEWADKATEIEELEVGLEKADIMIDDLTLIWIPTQ